MIVSSSQSLGDLLRLGKFTPAKIQRAYQWQTTEVAKLLDDLVATFQRMGLDPGEEAPGSGDDDDRDGEPEGSGARLEATAAPLGRRVVGVRLAPDTYFLGTVILLKARNALAYAIYDGFQRIVTATLLISALRDTWPDIPGAAALEIGDLLHDRRDKKRRLVYPTTGSMLEAIVNGGAGAPRRGLNDGDLRMREAAAYLRSQFDGRWQSARREAFLAFLTETVMVTVTETDNHSVAYQMFIGANARGLRLSIGDVVKSLIADLVRANGGTVAQVDACAAVWTRVQQSLQRDFDDFIHAVEVYQFRAAHADPATSRSFESAHTTGEKLQELFDETTPPEEICTWITQDFVRMANVFERMRQHHRLDKASGMDVCFKQLSFLEWKEWQPLLLSIGLKYDNLDSGDLAEEIRGLKRACYIVELLDWSESTRRRKFLEAVEAREAGRSPFGRQPRNKPSALYFLPRGNVIKNARRALRAPLTSQQKRGALTRYVETLHWKGIVPRTCTANATVEHVLPVMALGEWLHAFNDEQREALTNRLGNLCLLERVTNRTIGNKEWVYKAPEFTKWRTTFRGVDAVLGKSAESREAGEQYGWSPRAVEALTEELASLAEKDLGMT